MDTLLALDSLTALAVLVALSTTRIAVAFLLLPVFASETVPALVRNAFFVGLGIVTLVIQPRVSVDGWTLGQWIGVFLKEAFIGLALGLVMAAVLWAFEAAGQLVDTHAGATNAQLVDPLSGHQTSLSGALLGRLANLVFMAAGGFTAWIAVLLESYAVWPVGQAQVHLPRQAVAMFEDRFGDFASTALLLAGPSIVVLFMVDVALGLANRFAPQLSVLSISMSVKTLAAMLIWLMVLGGLTEVMQGRIHDAVRTAIPLVQKAVTGVR